MKNILISGSLAYDQIMFFDGAFESAILAEEVKNLSVSFLATSREQFFGGCAGNIAYSLKLLGENPYIFAVAGNDFEKYAEWLQQNQISSDFIEINDREPTAAAYILTDRNRNQIAFFSPSAMQDQSKCMIFSPDLTAKIDLVLVAPDIPERMRSVVSECLKHDVPYIFDPGQAMAWMTAADLEFFLLRCSGLIINEYERKLMEEKLNVTVENIAKKVPFAVETLGKLGARLYDQGQIIEIKTTPVGEPPDVTGGGDAFRAGFLHGYVNNVPLTVCCEFGNKAAMAAIHSKGSQNHFLNTDDFKVSSI